MKQLITDVLVVGGGTAGAVAAIGAAEEGAKVILVERDGVLGGVGVRGGIHYYYYGSMGGTQTNIDYSTRSVAKHMGGKSRGFHPEAKGLVLSERVRELGIEVVYDAVVADVVMHGKQVAGVIVETDREKVEILAKVTIDSTGDGDVAYLAGAEFTQGREWDGATHTYSLAPRYIDPRGVLQYKNFDIGWVISTDPRDVSRAYRAGRQYAWRGQEDPSNTHYTVIGPQLGIREGRIILGEYVLHQDDMLHDKRFDDVVMRCFSHHDTHTYDYANESDFTQIYIPILGFRKIPFGGDVPYRCFVPRQIDGLLIGCRALSQDHDCSMTLRMQRDMQKVGEVVGVAAALSVQQQTLPRNVSIPDLQHKLIARGVLQESDLQRESEPWMVFEAETKEHRRDLLLEEDQTRHVEFLIDYLGGGEEDIALWWIWQLGDICAPSLLEALPYAQGKKLRGIALGLGLIRHPSSVPLLANVFRSRDAEKKPDPLTCSEERWLAALILLKQQGNPIVASDVIEALFKERKSTTVLYMLHYLVAVAEQLTDQQKARLEQAIGQLLQDPELGDDYFVKGSHGITPTKGECSSMRWGIEITAGYLLGRIGGDGLQVLRTYMQDRRGYARTAAAMMTARLSEAKGAVQA
ncbi:FAD-dependent oxidoreductase [Paenibacillus thalictri]|uniref:FAD-dependent oxidoreductase n=1 Tax=Paenibacillus thalictri TaxID=2527873 RepID=A0A4Q9DL07_9BACL|nr:FAD-dependent oxidoreductase [Paenibacillus thalictri]TBL75679.1 FAD-dependent oxidoreductase [Paenibacillus thalictri]